MIPMKRHEPTEEWLRDHGVEFELKEIYILDVDAERSLHNQARFQPLDEGVLNQYKEAMVEGAQFPPIVAADQHKPNGLVILDGNHRFGAARAAGQQKIAAYIVREPTDRQVSVLTFDANSRHGLPTSVEERKAHAVYLVDTAGITQREAARMLQVPLQALNDEVARVRTERRMVEIGVERWQTIPRQGRMRFAAIRDNKVLEEASKLAVASRMNRDQISNLVTDVNKTKTVEDALAVIEAERARRESLIRITVGGRTAVPQDLMRLLRALTYIERIQLDGIDPDALPDANRREIVNRIDEVSERLLQVSDKLGEKKEVASAAS